MEYFGKGLYLIFFALVFWFVHRARGRGLGRLVEDNHRAHERVHHTLEEHPEGGTWRQYKQWMEDAK